MNMRPIAAKYVCSPNLDKWLKTTAH
jgi:hypothetical protein